MTLGVCLAEVGPFYSLALVIVAIILFLKLFSLKNKGVFLVPWKLLFIALWIYVVEEVIHVLGNMNILNLPRITNAFFEMIIIAIFVYLLLIQKEYLKNSGKTNKNEK